MLRYRQQANQCRLGAGRQDDNLAIDTHLRKYASNGIWYVTVMVVSGADKLCNTTQLKCATYEYNSNMRNGDKFIAQRVAVHMCAALKLN